MEQRTRAIEDVDDRCLLESSATFAITDQEVWLFEQIVRLIEAKGSPTCVRVAGGWVRDKLIFGCASNDIDFTLSDCTGEAFANELIEYLNLAGKRVGTSKANPSKSKHLETAYVQLDDFSLDFVNLRTEAYATDGGSEDGRIPIKVEFGTPSQDAFRRDFTVNALYYNLHTKRIEDYTGLGLLDIYERRLRTPLPAMQTFKDDPLRILRAVRFAARLDFSLSEEICDACLKVGHLLQSKISKERIGQEITGMLGSSCRSPHKALRLLVSLNMVDNIFDICPKQKPDWFLGMRIVDDLVGIDIPEMRLDDTRIPLLLTGFLFAYPPELIAVALSKHLKMPKRKSTLTQKLAEGAANFLVVMQTELQGPQQRPDSPKLAVGRIIFNLKENWTSAYHLASAFVHASVYASRTSPRLMRMLHLLVKLYRDIVDDWRLGSIWETRPLLNGDELKDAFPHVPVKDIGKLVELERNYRCCYSEDLLNPAAKTQAIEFIRLHI